MDSGTAGRDDGGGAEIARLAARMLGLVQAVEFRDAPSDSSVAARMATLAGYAALLSAAEFIESTLSAEERERARAVTPEIVGLLRAEMGAFEKTRGRA